MSYSSGRVNLLRHNLDNPNSLTVILDQINSTRKHYNEHHAQDIALQDTEA